MEMDSTGRFGSKSGAVLYTVGLVEMMQFGTNVICNSRKISETNCHTIGLDWTIHPQHARQQAGNKTLQGNTTAK